jgi:Family of unknown function (DUF6530)
MNAPTHLSHKPIVVANDYLDGMNALETDAKALSIGIAQYSGENLEISAKIFRHTGQRWSRQSEEMPIHRVLDLAILILSTLVFEKGSNMRMPLSMLEERVIDVSEFDKISEYYNTHRDTLENRVLELKRLIDMY